jgi:hypothetical protein
MIDRDRFERMRERYSRYGSWAVWAAASGKPKSGMGDLSVLDPDHNPHLLEVLRNDVVAVGLNISRPVTEPFRNFHDPTPTANDFKIRHAFTGTRFHGAYMTDIIKGVEMVDSTRLLRHVRENPALLRTNVELFLAELAELGSVKPTIATFGS